MYQIHRAKSIANNLRDSDFIFTFHSAAGENKRVGHRDGRGCSNALVLQQEDQKQACMRAMRKANAHVHALDRYY